MKKHEKIDQDQRLRTARSDVEVESQSGATGDGRCDRELQEWLLHGCPCLEESTP